MTDFTALLDRTARRPAPPARPRPGLDPARPAPAAQPRSRSAIRSAPAAGARSPGAWPPGCAARNTRRASCWPNSKPRRATAASGPVLRTSLAIRPGTSPGPAPDRRQPAGARRRPYPWRTRPAAGGRRRPPPPGTGDQTLPGAPATTAPIPGSGPAAEDHLLRKLEHLCRHQLPLAATAQGLAVVREHSDAMPSPGLWLSGYLFHSWPRPGSLPAACRRQ